MDILAAAVPLNPYNFQYVSTLGTGTFGRVMLVIHSTQYYALKILKKSEIIRLKQVEHIKSEKSVLTMLRHPFIVNMMANFQDSRNVYILLEYVPGGDLFSHLRRAGRFSNEVARFYAAEIASAIAYIHSKSIVYRDLKPENLLLDSEGHIKIADFGFAKVVLDRTWTVCGTPEYLPPEIIQSSGHGKAVDWWSFGVLIYEMINGFPPFLDDSPMGIYQKILDGRIAWTDWIEKDAKDLVKRLLTDKSKRLGNLRGGSEEVKKHKWFKSIDFSRLEARQIAAPFRPNVQHAGDTRNFDKYEEVDIAQEIGDNSPDAYGAAFIDF
ncbi:hypothetical protein MP228_003945 [Amoeboaphelidium protococcarum]|nr:hypothetical protein MP228_003945 [Amoeboaphelidium protococcarum]